MYVRTLSLSAFGAFHGSTVSSTNEGPANRLYVRHVCRICRTCGTVSPLRFLAAILVAISLSLLGEMFPRKERKYRLIRLAEKKQEWRLKIKDKWGWGYL